MAAPTNRSFLRFADEVKDHFVFLKALDFRCVRAEETFVRFESSKFAINVYHGLQSYEISLAIEDVKTSEAYSFSEILRLINNEWPERYRNYATHTVEGVVEGVSQLAKLLKKCVDAGILNDNELFSRLKLQRNEWARNYALEVQLEQALRKSESAWQEKDFEKVVQALAPLQEHLSPSDVKKLEYAKKHLNLGN